MDRYDVQLTFTRALLGAVPLDPELYRRWIIDHRGIDPEQAADELESAALGFEGIDEETTKGTTGFHRTPVGEPALYDYVLKGFFKDACGMLRRDTSSASAKVRAYKKVIDGMVFVEPRLIPLGLKGQDASESPVSTMGLWEWAGDEGVLTRPLRGQTAQGERVALARSIAVPAGTTMEFRVLILGVVKQSLLEEWFTYGALRGLGQWRNGGWGSFEYELTKR